MQKLTKTIFNYFSRRNRGWVFSLLLAVFVVYLPFLGNPFIFDDLPFIYGNNPSYFAGQIAQLNLRWLPYASLGWTWAFFYDAPHIFHLGNALLHAANVILLFYMLRMVLTAVNPTPQNISLYTRGAWLGSLVFACHPVAVYAVGYVMQRSMLMATFFVLIMQLSYMQGLLSGKKRWLVLSVVAYLMAVFSKEHSLLAPAILAAMTILLRAQNQQAYKMLVLTWIAFTVVGVIVVLRVKGVFGLPYEPMAAAMFEQQGWKGEDSLYLQLLSVLSQSGLYFKYLLHWLLPNPAWMSIDMRVPFLKTWLEWPALLGVGAFLIYGGAALKMLFRPKWLGLVGLMLLYPWLQFWVEFSSIRIQEPFVLYRSYLWAPGLMLIFPLLMSKVSSRHVLFLFGITISLLVMFSWNRLWVMEDQFRLWNDAALLLQSEDDAGADRIFYNRGIAELGKKNWAASIEDLNRVAKLSPKLAPVRYALGIAYYNAGRYEEAIAEFDVMLNLTPDDATAYYGKAISFNKLNKKEEAMQYMKRSCELKNMMACLISGRAIKQ